MTQRDERGYSVNASEFVNNVSRVTRDRRVELDMDGNGLTVTIEEGKNLHGRSVCNTFVHADVLVDMLKRAGYTITKP